MIESVRTGERVDPVISPVHPNDLTIIGSGWRFDWLKAVTSSEVHRLVHPAQPDTILGLLALADLKGSTSKST